MGMSSIAGRQSEGRGICARLAIGNACRYLVSSRRASVTRVHLRSLTALSFFRDFVAQNKPVVIEGAIGHWCVVANECISGGQERDVRSH